MSTTSLPLLLTVLGTGALLLPFVPMLRLSRRHETTPPFAGKRSSGQTQCEDFRALIDSQLAGVMRLARHQGSFRSNNDHGQPFLVLGMHNTLAEYLAPGTRHVRRCIIACGHVDIPGELVCDREIFAEGRIHIAHHTVTRALLSPRDIAIGPRARVTRWARSDRRIDIAEGAALKGWISAGEEIALARRASFQQLEAPRIVLGERFDPPAPIALAASPAAPATSARNQPGRHRVIPAGSHIEGDLILTGHLTIEDDCHIRGRIRADAEIRIGSRVQIEGALYSEGPISLGAHCQVSGSIISRESLRAGHHCVFGSPEKPCTLSADHIRLSETTLAHGAIHARVRGEVTDERE